MKTLSIKQPWAYLIANGIKNIENRTWKTNYRGRIYIHTSSKPAGNLPNILTYDQANYITCNYTMPPLVKDMDYSAIIGEVDIVDCVTNHSSIWAEEILKPNTHDYKDIELYNFNLELWKKSKPIYNWVLANPVLYDKPILNVKGKLSLWVYN